VGCTSTKEGAVFCHGDKVSSGVHSTARALMVGEMEMSFRAVQVRELKVQFNRNEIYCCRKMRLAGSCTTKKGEWGELSFADLQGVPPYQRLRK